MLRNLNTASPAIKPPARTAPSLVAWFIPNPIILNEGIHTLACEVRLQNSAGPVLRASASSLALQLAHKLLYAKK